MSFLGHKVSSEGLSPSQTNAKSIQAYQRPRTKEKLRRFLGMTQFYSKFIPRYAELLQFLYDAIGRDPTHSQVACTNIEESCFKKVKIALANSTKLAFPKPQATLELYVYTSEKAIRTVLKQVVQGE